MTEFIESTLVIELERTLFRPHMNTAKDDYYWGTAGWVAYFNQRSVPADERKQWRLEIVPILPEYVLFNDPLACFKMIVVREESQRIVVSFWGNRESIQRELKKVFSCDIFLVTAEHPN
jgi:hypothetical protein